MFRTWLVTFASVDHIFGPAPFCVLLLNFRKRSSSATLLVLATLFYALPPPPSLRPPLHFYHIPSVALITTACLWLCTRPRTCHSDYHCKPLFLHATSRLLRCLIPSSNLFSHHLSSVALRIISRARCSVDHLRKLRCEYNDRNSIQIVCQLSELNQNISMLRPLSSQNINW